jgi:hypothetical protein
VIDLTPPRLVLNVLNAANTRRFFTGVIKGILIARHATNASLNIGSVLNVMK